MCLMVDGICYGLKDGVATVARQPRKITVANIPASVTYKGVVYPVTSIGKSAFWDCTSLSTITIPSSVTSIGYWAFYNCPSLTIYCEVASQPSGWNSSWNPDNRPVMWGHTGES